jgi:hypothetical protein
MSPASTGSLTPKLLTREWRWASNPLYRNYTIKGSADQEHVCTGALALGCATRLHILTVRRARRACCRELDRHYQPMKALSLLFVLLLQYFLCPIYKRPRREHARVFSRDPEGRVY